MLIFYGEAQGRPNVPAESPAQESLENALNVFRSLDARRGFMGILLNGPFVLQLLPRRNGVRIELLDSSQPCIDTCDADSTLAERLIAAASRAEDVFQIARQSVSEWEHLKLG